MRKVLFLALSMLADPAQARPANTIEDVKDALRACVAQIHIAEGEEVTLAFQLNRRGGIIGQARITHAVGLTPEDAKAITASLERCLPIPMTDSLGGAIAGRPFAFRIVGKAGGEQRT